MPQFAAAAAPTAISLVGNKLFGGGGSKSTSVAPSPNSVAQTDLAKLITQMGKDHLTLTGPAYEQAQKYYQSILSGNPAANLQAMGPERRQITDLYGGASSRVNRTMTGASRDQANANIIREQTSHLADLIPNARADAASRLYAGADPSRAASLFGAASSAYGGANAAEMDAQRIAAMKREEARKKGEDFAKLFGNINWEALFGSKGGGKSKNATSFFDGTKAPW